MATDNARLLVATATAVGHPRAVAAALAELGPDGMAAALPFLQPAALDAATRKAVREGDWALDQLRDAAAEAAGVEPPPLERLRRVSLKGAVFTVLGTLLAYYVITSLADVDWSEIAADFQGANWALIGLGLLLSPFVQASYSFGHDGRVDQAAALPAGAHAAVRHPVPGRRGAGDRCAAGPRDALLPAVRAGRRRRAVDRAGRQRERLRGPGAPAPRRSGSARCPASPSR